MTPLRAVICNGPAAGVDDQVTELPLMVTTRWCSECVREHLWEAIDPDVDDEVYVLVDVRMGMGFYEHTGELVDELLASSTVA